MALVSVGDGVGPAIGTAVVTASRVRDVTSVVRCMTVVFFWFPFIKLALGVWLVLSLA